MNGDEMIGALPHDRGVRFRVWAPRAEQVELRITGADSVSMTRDGDYFEALAADARPGTRYRYSLDDGEPRPDPASRSQPDGVHGDSEVVDPSAFAWTDDGWRGLPLKDYVISETHIGTFTPEGTFRAAADRLKELTDLGVTAIEIMPVSQFPGERNWGYDGVFSFAPQNTYGGPEGLRALVDACHAAGIAVIMDVVYNHFGPEGAHWREFGPYHTDEYHGPWGDAINVDGSGSDEVRAFFIASARMWFFEYHMDALRLDAVHAIKDFSAGPFLRELAMHKREWEAELGRPLQLIAETDQNDPKMVHALELGGLGMDAQWSDDFHHAVHALLTGERDGYYADFGSPQDLAKAYTDVFVYDGRRSVFRGRRHGAPASELPRERFVVCIQNHDQTGNRMLGDRLAALVDFEALKLAAGALLYSPFVPMLFMGEEYGETNPFLYFTSHGETKLIKAVRDGRKREFASFGWQGEPPDPQSAETFERSKLNRSLADEPRGRALRDWYRDLIALRRRMPAMATGVPAAATARGPLVSVLRRAHGNEVLAVLNTSPEQASERLAGEWTVELDSADARWAGPGSPTNATVRSGETITRPGHSFLLLSRKD
ncbi:MAG TPA: malto-oligosyltrehalose trehalohydrolase [Actinomycetota bacterium]|nr:malto-oligosyltrehalose trehalohydrolase [Actinomycetota bacterium]